MAYPTVSYQHVGSTMGAQPISEASSTQMHPLGLEVKAKDGTYGEATFVYLKGAASTAAGDLVSYETDAGTTVRSVAAGATSNGPQAVAMSACDATTKFGWYMVAGSGPVNAATVSDNTVLYLTATAGQVDDVAASGELIDGIRAKAATSGGFATCQLNRPNVTGITSTGTNSGDVTLASVGASPAAAGASLSGQALTLQPASATHPGVLLAADFTKLAALTGHYITLSAAAEGGSDAIVVTGQVKDLATGANVAAASEVVVRTLAVTDGKGDITVTSGTGVKVVNPAAGFNEAWITTTAAGAFEVSVANDVAEVTLVTACSGLTLGGLGLTASLKLTFA